MYTLMQVCRELDLTYQILLQRGACPQRQAG